MEIDANQVIERYGLELQRTKHENILLSIQNQMLFEENEKLKEENRRLKEQIDTDDSKEGD